MNQIEQQIINRKQAKERARLRRRLRAIRDGRGVIQIWLASFEAEGWIEFGGPTENNPHNHWRLTPEGKAMLAQLEGKPPPEVPPPQPQRMTAERLAQALRDANPGLRFAHTPKLIYQPRAARSERPTDRSQYQPRARGALRPSAG